MNKLLICEDEKMIRHGIQAMVMHSGVAVDEIILCKNGEEAYDIIKCQEIDLLITDIRMPKKDGITLVREIQALPYVPKVIVISGYEDFTYAVELFRYGAKEYILKPVDRAKLKDILVKLEEEIKEEKEQKKDKKKIGCQQLKYILVNRNISEQEVTAIEHKFRDCFFEGEYVVCCTNFKIEEKMDAQELIYLEDISGQSIFIIKASKKEEILSDLLKNHYAGVSRTHSKLAELKAAYQEALYARKNAFVTGRFFEEYSGPEGEKETISDEMIDQFVQMIGTNKYEEAAKFLSRIIYKAKQGLIDPIHFEQIMIMITDKVNGTYKNLLNPEEDSSDDLKNIYGYDNAERYYEAISHWIGTINEKLIREFDEYKNKQKIQKAILYIQENYNKDLNMAVVSNYISMNYSLFSYLFKQHTKMNFVAYLKMIRINYAKKLLEETDKKIIEISNLAGYENEKNFMKIFKSVCGVSPTEYRKNVQVGRMSPNRKKEDNTLYM